MKKFGFISLIGAPNSGKSTLLNSLLGTKVSIVCHKRQTTRCRVAGVLTKENTQMVLLDTPGIFMNPSRRLERSMISTAWQAAFESDLILLLVDAAHPNFLEDVGKIMERLTACLKEPVLILNKIDLVSNKADLLKKIEVLVQKGTFQRVFMISAKTKSGIPDLEKYLLEKMPAGVWMYPEDQLSNLSERTFAAELTREVLLHQLHEEIPYGLTVQTEVWEEFQNGSVKIIQTIFIERESHKPILLGKGGRKIKAMGEQARKEMMKVLGRPVHLLLHVKVDERWQDRSEFYQEIGLDFKV